VVTDSRVSQLTARCASGEIESVVAVADAQVVGFASCGACRDDDRPGARELWALYVLPDWWGTGTGAALVEAAGALDVVWVLEGNARAIAFYGQQGFRPDGRTKSVDWLPEPHPTELRYVRP
jgi:GNAT superfamily N-acetyltransferase